MSRAFRVDAQLQPGAREEQDEGSPFHRVLLGRSLAPLKNGCARDDAIEKNKGDEGIVRIQTGPLSVRSLT